MGIEINHQKSWKKVGIKKNRILVKSWKKSMGQKIQKVEKRVVVQNVPKKNGGKKIFTQKIEQKVGVKKSDCKKRHRKKEKKRWKQKVGLKKNTSGVKKKVGGINNRKSWTGKKNTGG